MHLPSLAALLFAAVLAAQPVAAAAPDPSNNPSGPPPAAGVLNPPADDTELNSFVAAFVQLVGVQHGYMVMMQDQTDPARIEEMKQRALTDMANAVQAQGLTVDRYNQIATALQTDPDLQTRVKAILRQMAAVPDDEDGE